MWSSPLSASKERNENKKNKWMTFIGQKRWANAPIWSFLETSRRATAGYPGGKATRPVNFVNQWHNKVRKCWDLIWLSKIKCSTWPLAICWPSTLLSQNRQILDAFVCYRISQVWRQGDWLTSDVWMLQTCQSDSLTLDLLKTPGKINHP